MMKLLKFWTYLLCLLSIVGVSEANPLSGAPSGTTTAGPAGFSWDVIEAGDDGYCVTIDWTNQQLVFVTCGAGGISNVVEDTTPQLGGDLDVNGHVITGYQVEPSEGAFANGDKTKLDGIENAADVTDATNVAAAGALMDSGTDNIDSTHINWGTGAGQVSADDIGDGATNAIVTKAQETNWDDAYDRTVAFYNNRTALTGGVSGALDELSVSDLSDQDLACVRTGSQTEYHYIYDADGTAAENSPSVIRPDDYSTGGNWILQFTIIAGQLQLSEIAENILIADDDATGSWVASGNATAARTMNFIDADSRQVASSDVDSSGHVTEPLYLNGVPVAFCVAASDETTDLTTGTAKVTFRMPYAMTLTAVRASVNTAPVGSTLDVDLNESGTTVLSTKVTIDASEETSETAATEEVVSDSSLANDAEMTIDIDQIGSSTAGKGLKICLIGTRDYN